MQLARSPGYADARGNVEAAEIVVLQLRSHGQKDAIRFQGDFILHKSADELNRSAGWYPCLINRGHGEVGAMAIVRTPDKIVPGTQGQMVLEIKIKGIPVLAQCQAISLVPVEGKLQRGIGVAGGKGVSPASGVFPP